VAGLDVEPSVELVGRHVERQELDHRVDRHVDQTIARSYSGGMLVAQISDCHIMDPDEPFADRVDSAAGLRRAVATVASLEVAPDLVVLTGDLVNDGTSSQYDHLVELLGGLRSPILPLPGNHDDRQELRARFPDVLPGGGPDDPIDFVHDIGELRIVALDTTIPGRHDGVLTDAQVEWLDAQLSARPDRPTLIAQHHPPVSSGIAWMDATCGFDGGDREAEVLRRYGNVEAVVSGHLHRSLQCRYAGTISVTAPSTASPLVLALSGDPVEYTSEPTGVLLHHWRAGHGLVSHVVPVGEFDAWSPTWAT
jgi:3',5'-cyclic AMP phosphodiesterase CpdA